MRIAVTGAAGFVGGTVCRAAADAGWTVYGLRRHTWDITVGRLPDPPDVDAVVHCAGSVTDWAPRAEQWAANVDGTRNVLLSFPDVRFVHVSTASVYDPSRPTVLATEDQAPIGRYRDNYGASKAAAEHVVTTDRPNAAILRPHAVYGPGDPTLLPRVLGAVHGRRLIAVGDGTQRISLTSVTNLAAACLLAAASDAPGVFNVTDAEPVMLADALREILTVRGIPADVRFVPLAVALPLAYLAEITHRTTPPRLTRYAVRHLAHERTLDITAARTKLGYDPAPTSFLGAENW